MELKILRDEFCVCKLEDVDLSGIAEAEYCFFAKTDNELSLVCKTVDLPKRAKIIDGKWRGMRIVGQLDFSLVGILAKISGILANDSISIFAISTFDTDYIFVKDFNFDKAVETLKKNGYGLIS